MMLDATSNHHVLSDPQRKRSRSRIGCAYAEHTHGAIDGSTGLVAGQDSDGRRPGQSILFDIPAAFRQHPNISFSQAPTTSSVMAAAGPVP
jgi:hypothetical protein